MVDTVTSWRTSSTSKGRPTTGQPAEPGATMKTWIWMLSTAVALSLGGVVGLRPGNAPLMGNAVTAIGLYELDDRNQRPHGAVATHCSAYTVSWALFADWCTTGHRDLPRTRHGHPLPQGLVA